MATYVTCQATPIDDGVLLAIAGRIDFSNSASLHQEMAQHLTQRHPRVILDLTDLSHMDSSGVAILVQTLQTQTANKGKLVLCNLAPRVEGIFVIARLAPIFTIVPDVEAAKTV